MIAANGRSLEILSSVVCGMCGNGRIKTVCHLVALVPLVSERRNVIDVSSFEPIIKVGFMH